MLQHTIIFFYKQPFYKQLGLGWEIANQLSGFNPLSLRNNKNYISRKGEFFLCNKRKIVLNDNAPKFSYLKSISGKILKSVILDIGFEFCELLHSSQT